MYHPAKQLMYPVRVDDPDAAFGKRLLEHFGGPNGELAAAVQYSIQGLNADDPARRDLLMDIAGEELSHLEIVGTLARLHLKASRFQRYLATADPYSAIAGGRASLHNSAGQAWPANYLKITGDPAVDLRSNIAAEVRAKSVYQGLIQYTTDPGTRDALEFLMARESTHMEAFADALRSLGQPTALVPEVDEPSIAPGLSPN